MSYNRLKLYILSSNGAMRISCIFLILFLNSIYTHAQSNQKSDDNASKNVNHNRQLKKKQENKKHLLSDESGLEPKKIGLVDTTVQNKYGDLLNDDSLFNKKYPIWIPAVEVFGVNFLTFSLDRFVGKYDFSVTVGPKTWRDNLKNGWEWDTDRFGINFIGHPYSGTMTFNAARSNGYNYLQSIPFAIGGSLMWEYFGENTKPSYNDIINTPINGAFIGEIFYRLSSNILDDRTRGSQRFFRELAAGLIDPVRGFNRLIQGKTFRNTSKEVYQKEPLNVTLYAGIQKLNNDLPAFQTKNSSQIFNLQFDYGNPFENRTRKAFDLFRFRADFNFGIGRKILDNLTGYGILTGKNYQVDSGRKAMLLGLFQYYDYWDNFTFELGAIGIGGGFINKIVLSTASKSNLYTALHLAAIPLAGTSARYSPDTTQVGDYNYGSGFEGKFETTLNFSKYATATFVAYAYWIHSYVGPNHTHANENNLISIFKPRVTVTVIKNLSIGFEEAFYTNRVHYSQFATINNYRSEQKVILILYLEDKQRRGHYN